MELRKKALRLGIVKKLIVQAFKSLEEKYQYVPEFVEETSNLFAEGLRADYINNQKLRTINVSYIMSYDSGEPQYSFTISIIRQPYREVEDFFSLEMYLMNKNINCHSSFHGLFDEIEANNILSDLSYLLLKHAPTIIDGKEWLSEYYPRKD